MLVSNIKQIKMEDEGEIRAIVNYLLKKNAIGKVKNLKSYLYCLIDLQRTLQKYFYQEKSQSYKHNFIRPLRLINLIVLEWFGVKICCNFRPYN